MHGGGVKGIVERGLEINLESGRVADSKIPLWTRPITVDTDE